MRETRSLFVALVVALATLGLLPHSAFAQGSNDGSVYSRFGLGELQLYGSPQIEAMGGGGTAMGGARYTNFSNPASFGHQILTGIAAGAAYESIDAEDANSNTARLSSSTLSAVQFSFPLRDQKLGVGASFAPFSTSRYRVRLADRLEGPTPADTASFAVDYTGSGGLHQTSLGVGYTISPNISVGVSGQFVFGLIEESQETTFARLDYRRSVLSNSTRMRGVNGTMGVLVTIPTLRSANDYLRIGVTYSLPFELHARRVIASGDPQERDTLSVIGDGDIDVPYSFSAGIAYRHSPKLLFLADWRYEPWANLVTNIALPGVRPGENDNLRNRSRLSAGVEFLPAGNDLNTSYLRRVGIRLGGFYDPSYVSPDPQIDVSAVGGTIGFSLPTLLPGTRIDVNLEAGRRGSTENSLVRDVFYRIGLNLNVGERWFLKTRLG